MTDTSNDFLIGYSNIGHIGRALRPTLPVIIRTRQQAYRTAAWIKLMAQVLPDEQPALEYDEIEQAVANT